MAENLNQWAQATFDEYKAKIAALMGVRVTDVNFKVAQTGNGVAETSGNTITLDPDWFKKHPNDVGAIIHETVHAFLGSDSSGDKWHEGLGEYVRSKLGFPASSGYHAEERDFFLWLDKQRPGSVRRLTQEMADGSYKGADFQAIVGVNYQTAHQAYTSGARLAAPQPGDPGYIPGPGHAGPGPGGSPTGGSSTGAGGGDTVNVGGLAIPDTDGDGTISAEEYKAFMDSGGGGGDGNHRARERAKRDAAADYRALVQSYGIPMSNNISQLIDQAVARKYGENTFMEFLRKTPEYHETFRGIFEPGGEMRMTEAEYIQTIKDYKNIASQAGLNMTDKQAIWNIKHDVTSSEYADRADSISRLNRNSELFAAFKKELVDNGVAKPGDVTKKALQKFVLGQGNKLWADLWQDSVTRNQAKLASLTFKKHSSQYLNLNENVLEKISGRDLSEDQMNAAFNLAADVLLKDLPSAHIQGLGLSKKAIVAAAFGGKGSAEARAKIERVQKNAEAANTNELAAAPSYVGEGGKLGSQSGLREGYTG